MAIADLIKLLIAIAVVTTSFGLLGLLIASIIYGLRRYDISAQQTLERQYDDLEIHEVPMPGDVHVVYHTYHGIFGKFTQTRHLATLPPDDARELLRRLFQFNLTRHGFSPWMCLLCYLNYVAQRRSISRQEVIGGTPPVYVQRPSAAYRFLGLIFAILSFVLAISVVLIVLSGEFEKLPAGVLVTAVTAWISRKFSQMRA